MDTGAVHPMGKQLEQFEREVADLCQVIRIPGLSAAIVSHAEVIWAQGFGWRDIEQRLPATPETVYPIHSITKTFASVLIMQLVEGGQLDLDTPVWRFIPDYPGHRSTTVRHLLNHTSQGMPGERFRYDGARFNLLTTVIEQVAGMPFVALLTRRILDPLRLRRTCGPGARGQMTSLDQVARLYALDDERQPRPVNVRFFLGAAGVLFSTVLDLARYDRALDRHELLTPASHAQVVQPAVSSTGRQQPYGLGWFVQSFRGVKLVWHYGIGPTSSLLLKVPEHHLTLILLANSDGISSYRLHAGDVLKCPFAGPFLRLFVLGSTTDGKQHHIDWTLDRAALAGELDRCEQRMASYIFADEVWSRGLIHFWQLPDLRPNVELLKLAVQRYPSSSAVLHAANIDFMAASGDPELEQVGEAIGLKLLHADPDNSELMLSLGRLVANAGEPERRQRAYSWFERILAQGERAGARERAWSGYLLGKQLLDHDRRRARAYLELAQATGYTHEGVAEEITRLLHQIEHETSESAC